MKNQVNNLILNLNILKQNYDNEIETIQKQLNEQISIINKLNKEIDEKKNVENENIELKNKINELMEIVKELEKDNNLKEKSIENYQNNINDLNNFNQSIMNENQIKDDEIKKLKSQILKTNNNYLSLKSNFEKIELNNENIIKENLINESNERITLLKKDKIELYIISMKK